TRTASRNARRASAARRAAVPPAAAAGLAGASARRDDVMPNPYLRSHAMRRAVWPLAVAMLFALAVSGCRKAPSYRTYATPEDAVRALIAAVKGGNLDEVIKIFGPEGQ